MTDFSYVIYLLEDELGRIEEDLENDAWVGNEKELRKMENRKKQLKKLINILLDK